MCSSSSVVFSLGLLVSSTNKTDRHDITEILLKNALTTIKPNQNPCTRLVVNLRHVAVGGSLRCYICKNAVILKEFKSALDLPCNPVRTLVWFGLVWFYGSNSSCQLDIGKIFMKSPVIGSRTILRKMCRI
jgi:hypothetical protein